MYFAVLFFYGQIYLFVTMEMLRMKQRWTEKELHEAWQIWPAEQHMIEKKWGATRLGFALLLKFFQIEGRFPSGLSEIPVQSVRFVAEQVGVAVAALVEYPWEGRVLKYHRAQIREWCGFREGRAADLQGLKRWLVDDVIPEEQRLERLREAFLQRCREMQIEPPAQEKTWRFLKSALQEHETAFCEGVLRSLSPKTVARLDALLVIQQSDTGEGLAWTPWQSLKADPGKAGVTSVMEITAKLRQVRGVELPADIFKGVTTKLVGRYAQRAAVEEPHELRRHAVHLQVTLQAAYLHRRSEELTDHLVDLLIETFHKLSKRAEKRVEQEQAKLAQLAEAKQSMLPKVARAILDNTEGSVSEVILPVASLEWWEAVLEGSSRKGAGARASVRSATRRSFTAHYRRILPELLGTLEFLCANPDSHPVMQALEVVKAHLETKGRCYPKGLQVPLRGVVRSAWIPLVIEDESDPPLICRSAYEVCTIKALREQLRCREIWVSGSRRYRNPEEDLPSDFEDKKALYYDMLNIKMDAKAYTAELKAEMSQALQHLDKSLPENPKVSILAKRNGWIKISPFEALPDPENLAFLKEEIKRRWPMTSLLDVLKEADHLQRFTRFFRSPTPRERMDPEILRRRLLLCLYGIGTNAGLTRMTYGVENESFRELLYIRKRYISAEALRQAIMEVANATLAARLPRIWGEATTACASDSKQFAAWDQNLLTEWHVRYGGRGVMVYWHVEMKSVCIYSQFKRVSSSEAAFMIEGVLRHCTEMEIDRQYVDSHGQSVIAFAFCRLLGFELMPRFKAIHKQRLYRPETGQKFPNLEPVMPSRGIDWEVIEQQLDTLVKHAVALKMGTADAESLLRRFTRTNVQHPAYKALTELGKAVRTIFLCRYLESEALRREVNEGLNVAENWNSANDFILFGKKGEIGTNKQHDMEISLLCLHLIQSSLVYINTLMIQEVLEDPVLLDRMTPRDLGALSPLLTSHVTPFGRFDLDMTKRIPLKTLDV